ncbi:MAG: Ig domain-containing protein [Pseudolysinimonas sp.]
MLPTMRPPLAFLETVPTPADASSDEKKQVKELNKQITAFNESMRNAAAGLTRDDRSIGRVRFAIVVLLSLATLVGAGVVALAVLTPDEQAVEVITGGSIFLIALLVAAVMNPLQTVERDFVFRRWSDSIVANQLIQLSMDSDNLNVAALSARTSRQFAQLATSYASLASKNTNALVKLAGSIAPKKEDEEPATLAIADPGAQTHKKGVAIATPVKLVVTAAENYGLDDAGTLPKGLSLNKVSGEVSGTPSEKKDYKVKVTATGASGKTASVDFDWKITE